MKKFIDAIHRAAEDTAGFMTKDLRAHTQQSGWSKDASKSIRVEYSGGKFTSKVSGKHQDAAFVHEYGDEEHPPSAAIRRYAKKAPNAEKAFLANLSSEIKGML